MFVLKETISVVVLRQVPCALYVLHTLTVRLPTKRVIRRVYKHKRSEIIR